MFKVGSLFKSINKKLSKVPDVRSIGWNARRISEVSCSKHRLECSQV